MFKTTFVPSDNQTHDIAIGGESLVWGGGGGNNRDHQNTFSSKTLIHPLLFFFSLFPSLPLVLSSSLWEEHICLHPRPLRSTLNVEGKRGWCWRGGPCGV